MVRRTDDNAGEVPATGGWKLRGGYGTQDKPESHGQNRMQAHHKIALAWRCTKLRMQTL